MNLTLAMLALLLLSADEKPVTHGPSTPVPVRRAAVKAEADQPEIKLPISVTPVAPTAVTELTPVSFFVIECQVECLVLASRQGFVKTVREVGPLRLRGHFADGVGVETRNYTAPILWLVEAVADGEVELLVVPKSATDDRDVIRRTLVVSGIGPRPPPQPPTPPGPTPPGPQPPTPPTPVDPTPIPVSGNRLLIVYETMDVAKLPASQAATLTSTVLRTYLTTHAATSRFLDPDTVFTQDDQVWRDAMKITRGPLPWMYCSNGTTGYSGPLPASVEETIAILKKYFGE